MDKCKNKAVTAFPWAGKIHKCCKQHTKALSVLNQVIGGVQTPRALPENSGNCEMNNDLEEV